MPDNGGGVFLAMLPTALLILVGAVIALLGLVRARLPLSLHRWLGAAALAGAAAVAVITFRAQGPSGSKGLIAYSGGVVADRFDAYAILLLCAAGLLVTLASGAAATRLGSRMPAFHALVLTATAGGTVIAVQWEMAMLAVGLGLLVTSLVGLVALEKAAEAPPEAAFRTLAASGVALALLLYGLAIVYGATGTTDLSATRGVLPHAAPLEGLGLTLVLLGLSFLVGAAPFHHWLLQVAMASSGVVAGAVISLAAAAGGIALVRVMVSGFGATLRPWVVLAGVLGAAASLYPALLSLVATSLRRVIGLGASLQGALLIIALTGSGLGTDGRDAAGVVALLFALAGFVLAVLASFHAVARLEAAGIGSRISDLPGLSRRAPMTSALLALGLVGLAGLPPLVGFIARILIVQVAISSGFAWVAAAAVAASIVYAIPAVRWLTAIFVEDEDLPVVTSPTPRLAGLSGSASAVFGVVATVVAGPLLYAATVAAAAVALH